MTSRGQARLIYLKRKFDSTFNYLSIILKIFSFVE